MAERVPIVRVGNRLMNLPAGDTVQGVGVGPGAPSGAVSTDALWAAKGDLAVGTGAETADKLTVGANNTFLVPDSAATTGLKWITAAAVKALLSLVKGDVGLGNVDNTSDASKPISTATQTALDGKSSTGHDHAGVYATAAHNHAGVYEPADADIQTVVGNTSGTNTGDNATNTQYSGLAASKQDTLVSATNIKTVNGATLLGSGDLVVSGSDPGLWTTIVKTANQDVTNLGVTADTQFTFAVVAGGHYAIDADLIVSGNNTTSDITMDFQVSAGTMKGKGTCQNLTAAAAIQNIIITAAAAANTTAIVTGTPADIDDLIFINAHYAFTASANATLTFRFGNAAAASGRTSRVWKGSVFKYKRLD